jgi:hypothetical protein
MLWFYVGKFNYHVPNEVSLRVHPDSRVKRCLQVLFTRSFTGSFLSFQQAEIYVKMQKMSYEVLVVYGFMPIP